MNRKRQVPDGAFWIADASHRPQFSDGKNNYPGVEHAFYQALTQSFPQVDPSRYTRRALQGVATTNPRPNHFYPRGMNATLHADPGNAAEMFNVLFSQIEVALQRARSAGLKEGADLLVRLARGDMTVRDFDAKVS